MHLSPKFYDGIFGEEREVGVRGISEDAWLLKWNAFPSISFLLAMLHLISVMFHYCLRRGQKLSTEDTAEKYSDWWGIFLFQRFIFLLTDSG